jgi:uncharacterized GH25 family protein
MSAIQMRTEKGAVLATEIGSVEWQYDSHGQDYRTTTADGWRELTPGQYVTADGYNVFRVERINGHGQPVLVYWATDRERFDRAVRIAHGQPA